MQSRFQNENLDVTRWIASTPETLIDTFHSYLSMNESACAQSHICIWRHIVDNHLEYAFVLEDDACFDRNWRTKLTEFQINDPQWELLLLNASEPIDPTFRWVNVRDQFLTAGYILSIRGALKLLHLYNNMFASSDWMTRSLQENGHSYSYFPWLIIQEGLDSSLKQNGETPEQDHAKVVRCLSNIGYDISNYNIYNEFIG